MFCDQTNQGEQVVLDAYAAKDLTRARAGMAQLLAEQLKDAIPAMEREARERLRFDGSRNTGEGADEIFLQFITSRAEAEKAVLGLPKLKGDLLTLVGYARENQLSLRGAIRQAVVAADCLKWLGQDSGWRYLLQTAGWIQRQAFLTVVLEPEDAASEARIKLLKALPGSLEYIKTTIHHLYADAAGDALNFQVSIDDDLDDENGTMRDFIENLPDTRITNGTALSKLRRRTLLAELKDVRDGIPGTKVMIPGKKNFLTLGTRHQQLFELWLSLDPAVRSDVEMTFDEMCVAVGCSDKTLTEDFKRLQVALSQHPKYPRILELMLPIRLRGNVPPDYRERFEQAIRDKRKEFRELVESWWRDLE